MDNRREVARFRKLKSGKVIFDNSSIACTVKSLSDSGACLELQTTHGLPGKFELGMTGEESKVCTVAWADEKKLGVRFK